ncbi:twin-arginine translocase TatA/TatE family subunit [bacterium]|nr:twin-arginine translocase TatA/TatE family subunit [bacterium]
MFGLGTTELILILVVILIIFGAGKLPEIGSGLGKAIKNFKRSSSETDLDAAPRDKKEHLK